MITIQIDEETNTHSDAADMLRHIADLIDKGFTRAYEPSWEISGNEEPETDDEE